ncbi:hypothetical protein Afil01_08190 [Actinorhabdospora filicis]|uniref:Rhamnogalacturonase A/B/Epimerase-like pectate lyase domain-containing protein n=1 Tax=Actinorhabdospora filicis TaxID=1785913 RepID=A0A9W6W1L0_9ACTN|nr:right-handed parallel beta-helix repeat-containing protein [Actinorhabdospora filicis]GLZ76012.1 hypothetical protein Afil01_08190 [Actinorhabdospora filicis]
MTETRIAVGDRTALWLIGVATTFGMLVGALLLGDARPAAAATYEVECPSTSPDHTDYLAAEFGKAKRGDEVVVKGTCVTRKTLWLKDGVTYRGDGRDGAVLKQADGAKLAALVATDSWALTGEAGKSGTNANVTVRSLTIDANAAGNAGAATIGLVVRAWDSRVYDVAVYRAGGDGIRVTTVTSDGTVLANGSGVDEPHTMVNSIIADSYVEESGRDGISVEDPGNGATDWIVERNWIAGSARHGIGSDNAAGWQIRNNHVYGVGENAIDLRRCYNTGVHDNYIEDFGGNGGAERFGIRCDLQGDVPSTIAGNKINQFRGGGHPMKAGTYFAIGLDGVNYGKGYATVTGNAIVGTAGTVGTETGLAYRGGADLTVVSTGNLVTGCDTALSKDTGVVVTSGI